MKKQIQFVIIVAFLCLTSSSLEAQSPRMQLFEYFDNMSIPAFGAVANRIFDSVANANTSRLVTIKYHVSWGSSTGTDTMNLQNPLQVAKRVSYYGVTSDPQGYQDGGVHLQGTFNGQPALFNQSDINHRRLTTSPYTIAVLHGLNAAHDSIYTHTVITKTGAVTGVPKAYVVVIEKRIRFASAPGPSGDTVFLNVMKEMLPSDAGIHLPAMIVGDSVVLNLSWKLANVYDTTQLAVISFVQDSVTHEVYQAGPGAAKPLPLDAGIAAFVLGSYSLSCDSVSSSLKLYNYGVSTIASATISYKVDNGSVNSFPWTGSLSPGTAVMVNLPKLLIRGHHLITAYSSLPNGSADNDMTNDTTSFMFAITSAPVLNSIPETFQSANFPPANWVTLDPDGPNHEAWILGMAGGFGVSTQSAKYDCYNIATGNTADLYPPALDLSNPPKPTSCTFNVAHAEYSTSSSDSLLVRVSTDCGLSWTTVYSKGGAGLATAPDTTAGFVPKASQWRHESINLSAFNGHTNVQIQFHGISGYGNGIYVDDINIADATGIPELNMSNEMHIYPNPANGKLNIKLGDSLHKGTLGLYTLEGQRILQQTELSGDQFVLDLSGLSKGIYFLHIQNEQNNLIGIGKVVVQ